MLVDVYKWKGSRCGWGEIIYTLYSSSETNSYFWVASSSSGALLLQDDADRERLRFGLLSDRMLEFSMKIAPQ